MKSGLVLAVGLLAATATSGQPFTFGRSEQLSDTTKGEVVKGKTVKLKGTVRVIFMSPTTTVEQRAGTWKYFPLKDKDGWLLVEDVRVECPPGLTAKVTSADATRATVAVGEGTGEGFKIDCEVEIGTQGKVAPGTHTVTVRFHGVSDVAKVLKASRPTEPPTMEFPVKVYESEEARQAEVAAQKAAEEKSRREREEAAERIRRADEAASERQRQQREADARRWREAEEDRTRQRQEAEVQAGRAYLWRLGGVGASALLLPLAFGAYARWRWRSIRPLLTAGRAGQEPPGLIRSRLSEAGWGSAFRATVGRAGKELAAGGHPLARRVATALDGSAGAAVEGVARSAAGAAVRTGEVQSRLVTSGGRLVYVLAFPEPSTHGRSLRHHPGLADGWLAHAAAARRRLAGDGPADELLCLLFFLSPDARTGRLAVAYEADDGRLASGDLVAGDPGGDGRPLVTTGDWEFRLAPDATAD